MQRKNNFLNYYTKKSRPAMAMILAITTIIIMTSIMALSLSMTTQTTKRSSDLYLYEQSILLSKSATEYALLQIANNPPCSAFSYDTLNFVQDSYYDVNISLGYIYDSNSSCISNGGTLYTTVTTPEQNGSVMIDVAISVTDKTISTEPIRFFKRTLQKL